MFPTATSSSTFSLPFTMSRRDHNALQIPCGYLKCARFFKTQAGQKKHWNSAHRTFTVSHTTTVGDDSEELPDDNFTADHNDFSPGEYDLPAGSPDLGQSFGEPDNPDNVDTEFWGPRDKLYRNFHSKLNGTFLNVFDRLKLMQVLISASL